MDVLLFALSSALTTGGMRRLRQRREHYQGYHDLRQQLEAGTSLNAHERICTVTPDNRSPLQGGHSRAEMRLQNLWHRATYVLVKHLADHVGQHEDTYVLVQRRSRQKDYCPGKLDPTPGGVVGYGESYVDNAQRELMEEMGIDTSNHNRHRNTLVRLFTFPYKDDQVRVWGEFFECTYRGALKDLKLQEEEVDEVLRLSIRELKSMVAENSQDFMPDACHAMRLYFQHQGDVHVNRRILQGSSSSNLDSYALRPNVSALFFDCDDTLYWDGWKTANRLTAKIDEWCVNHGLKPGQAYDLYKQYGTALRGLLAEGYLEETTEAIDGFLHEVHSIQVHELLQTDNVLREMLLRMDPTIPKYIFTASVAHHAERCLRALGIEDLFVGVVDCKMCDFESKHAEHSFRVAMEFAGVQDPEQCLFFDDNLTNIQAASAIGWRCVLVGRLGRDCGQRITSLHAELEVDRIHELPKVLPELFPIPV